MDSISWLLQGDPSIVYLTQKNLLKTPKDKLQNLQKSIGKSGWAAEILNQQNPDGHWGRGYYQPKWTSTHYSLQDLRNLCLPRKIKKVDKILNKIVKEEKGSDGGINPSGSIKDSDVCINGMALNFLSWFGAPEEDLNSIVDFILSEQMDDGGFNCRKNRMGATHSSMHSSICTLEGLWEYERQGYTYRLDQCKKVRSEAEEFLLEHRLYKSDKTGHIIHKSFTRIPYPYRWHYDILRALYYFWDSDHSFNERMDDALESLKSKQRKDDLWPVNAPFAGEVHLTMESPGKASRWNTLRALSVLGEFFIVQNKSSQ